MESDIVRSLDIAAQRHLHRARKHRQPDSDNDPAERDRFWEWVVAYC